MGTLNLKGKGRTPKRRESVATWLAEQSRASPLAVPPQSARRQVNTFQTPSLPKPQRAKGDSNVKSVQRAALVDEAADEEEEASEDELSPEQPVTASGKKRRKTLDRTEDDAEEEEQEEGQSDDIADELSPEVQYKRSQRKPDQHSEEEPADEEEDNSQPTPARPAKKPKALPQPRPVLTKRISKPKAQRTKGKEVDPNHKQGKSESVPITVYRLANASKLSGGAVDDDGDPLRNPNLTAISGVNAVDVLFQITGEIADRQQTAITRALEAEDEDGRRSELKRKRGVVDMFKNQLSDRLLELTEAVNTGYLLKKRLQAALKRRVGLTDELLALRRQREELQLNMDATRDRHDAGEREREKHNTLNTALHDIELAIKRGKQAARDQGREDEGPTLPLEMLLRDVAGDVSLKQAGGGLLDRTRGLNRLLENTADVLEGRV